MSKGRLPQDAPWLKGWVTMPQLADMLRTSRASVHKHMLAGDYETLTKLGERPFYIIRESEAFKLVEAREGRLAYADQKRQATNGVVPV